MWNVRGVQNCKMQLQQGTCWAIAWRQNYKLPVSHYHCSAWIFTLWVENWKSVATIREPNALLQWGLAYPVCKVTYWDPQRESILSEVVCCVVPCRPYQDHLVILPFDLHNCWSQHASQDFLKRMVQDGLALRLLNDRSQTPSRKELPPRLGPGPKAYHDVYTVFL